MADAVATLIAHPARQRPFRTTVDTLGMGKAVDGYSRALKELTEAMYTNFGIVDMLSQNRLTSA